MKLPYDMNFIWMAINLAICIVLMFVLPMAMILYSDDSEDFTESIKFAAKISGLVAVFHIICVCLYVFLVENAHIPVKHVTKLTSDFLASNQEMIDEELKTTYFRGTSIVSNFVRVKLGLLNCCTLHLTVIGSILLVFLGGYGLALFPMEFLNAFLNRPQIVADFLPSVMPRIMSSRSSYCELRTRS